MSKQSKEIEDRMGKLSTRELPILFLKRSLYSMKIKEQTRKLAAGCSKHGFEVVDRTDEVSSKYCFEVAGRTDEVSHIYILR